MKFLNHNLFTGDITVNGTTTLSTATGVTRATGDNTTHLATTAFVKAQDYATNTALGNYVPVSRTLTINGVTLDLSANRSWTIATSDYTSTLKHIVKAGVAITKGQAVYVTSADGTNMIVGLASNTTEATSSKTMGLVDTTVAVNGFTSVITEGLLAGLNTSAAETAGEPVWLGLNGNLIFGLANKPYAPAHLVFIGIVTRVSVNNGEIFVKVQNGFELREIHDVDLITTAPINGHLLGYNGTLWVNKTIAGWLGYTPANASGTTNYVSKFTGTTTLGNSQIFDNGTNVGIGTASPAEKLAVAGNIRSAGNVIASVGLGYGNYISMRHDDTNGYITITRTVNAGHLILEPYGNVGIGITNPARLLDINGTTNFRDAFYFSNGGVGYTTWGTIDGALALNIQAASGYAINLGTNASTGRVVITSGGNVGIGTTEPAQKLHVKRTETVNRTSYTDILTIDADANNSPFSGHGGGILFRGTTYSGGGNNVQGNRVWGRIGMFLNDFYDGFNGESMFFAVAPDDRSDTLTTAMTIQYDGKVGIGTTSPSAKLDIGGNTVGSVQAIFGRGNDDSAFTVRYTNGSAGTSNTVQGTIGLDYASGTWADMAAIKFIRDSTAGILAFYTSTSATSGTERMRITSGGNVLIGTTTDNGYKLRVNGKGYFDNNVVIAPTSENWAEGLSFVMPTTGTWGGLRWRRERVGNDGNWYIGYTALDSTDDLVFGANNGGTQVDNIIRLTKAGNVGIGTTAPTEILNISRVSTNNYIKVEAGGQAANYSGLMLTEYGINWGWALRHNAATDLLHISYQDNTPTFSDTVTFNRNGNVGIGTTSPTYKLQVNGEGNGLYVIGANSAPYNQTIAKFVYGGNNNSINIENQAGKASFQARDNSDAAMSLLLNPVAGSVLIGTGTDAGYKLAVSGTTFSSGNITTDGYVFANSEGLSTRLRVGGIYGNLGLYIDATYNMQFDLGWNGAFTWTRGNAEKMRLTYDGKVGIGTANPTEKLHVAGRIMAAGSGYTLNPTAPIFGQYAPTRGYVQVPTNGQFEIWNGGTAEIATFYENRNSVFHGNVLIGTTADTPLSTARGIVINSGAGNDAQIRLQNNTTGSTSSDGALFSLSGTGVYLWNYENGAIFFGTNNSTRITITSAGNVGIGLDNPSTKLHVAGSVRISIIDNGTGDFATISGTGVITRRTAAQVLSDIGAQPSGSYLTAETDTLASVTARGNTTASTVNFSTLNASDTNARYYYQSTNGVPSNNLGNPTITEMALFDEQFNNKTAFYDPASLTFWTSSDGTNYTEYTGFNTTIKKRFLGGDSDSGVYIPNLTNRFRIELENSAGYVFLNQLYIYWSSNSHSTKVHIWVRRCDNNQWYQWTDSNVQVSSWPGHLYLPFSGIPFYPGYLNSTGHFNRIRIEFIPTWSGGTYSYTDINLNRMQIWGGYPAGKRNVYSTDENQNVVFPAEVGSTSFYATNFRASNAYYLNGTSYYLNSTNGGIYTNARFESASTIHATGGNSTNWNTAYGWGNHAGLYSLVGHVHTFASITSKPTTIAGYGITDAYTDTQIQNFFNGANAITGYNKSNWDTAFGWGNHASQSYATQTYVNTAIANLVDSAPATLDTLNELAAALGDDPNFATTVTNSIAAKLPLAGGTMTGTIYFSNDMGTALQGTIGDNDFWRIRGGNAGSNAGFLEIATSDDGTEPIYVRQYTGVFSSLTRTATLLDGSGNTSLPGSLTVGGTITENSSIRYKENIVDLESATEKVEQLRAVRYNKIGHEIEEIGLIAEEVVEVYPEVVNYNEEGQPDGVNYTRLSVILLKAVQELTERINKLESK